MHPMRALATTGMCLLAGCSSISPMQTNSLPSAVAMRTSSTFDHSVLDRVLGLYVDDAGLVDYRGLAGAQGDLTTYIESLASTDPSVLASDDERKAYWINAYNAITLAGILHYYPTRSIRDLPGFWQRITTNCGGQVVSLDQIEHEILRPMGDPHVHMAINCASMSCPKLANHAYTGAALEGQLDVAARAFLGSPQRNRFDSDGQRAQLSMIFSWFGSDFAVKPYSGVRGFVRRYGPTLPWLAADFPVDYLPYDWSLNDRPAGRP